MTRCRDLVCLFILGNLVLDIAFEILLRATYSTSLTHCLFFYDTLLSVRGQVATLLGNGVKERDARAALEHSKGDLNMACMFIAEARERERESERERGCVYGVRESCRL